MSFKVIEVGINRKPVCDLLLVINTNWHPVSYRYGVIAAYCSNFGTSRFLSPLILGSLESAWLPLVLIELFSLGITAEALRAKIDRKSAISLQPCQFDPKFQIEGVDPPIIFARIVRSMNALQLCRWQFSHKEKQTFFKRIVILHRKRQRPFHVFEPPQAALIVVLHNVINVFPCLMQCRIFQSLSLQH